MKARLLNLFLALVAVAGACGVARAALLQAPEQDVRVSVESPAYHSFREGVAALLKSDLKAAEAAFRAAAGLDPRLAPPLIGLADVAMKRGQPADAEKWLTAASRAQPEADAVDLAWGRYHLARKDLARAEQAFRRAIATRPSATAYLELGDLCLADKARKREALAAYEKALTLAPHNASARFSFATGLAANGQVDRALKEFEQVARERPKDPEPWRTIGRLHAERHRFDAAAAALDNALKLQPKSIHLLVDRGDVAAAQGKLDDAVHYYQQAARLAPGASPVLIKLGLAHQLSRQWGKAEAAYLRAIESDPKAADAYNNLAWLAMQQGKRKDEAVTWAGKAAQLKPDSPAYLDTLGWAYQNRGELDKAAETLRKAVSLQPALADAQYHLGIVYAVQGRKVEAVSALRRALEIDATFPMAADARARLKALGG